MSFTVKARRMIKQGSFARESRANEGKGLQKKKKREDG